MLQIPAYVCHVPQDLTALLALLVLLHVLQGLTEMLQAWLPLLVRVAVHRVNWVPTV